MADRTHEDGDGTQPSRREFLRVGGAAAAGAAVGGAAGYAIGVAGAGRPGATGADEASDPPPSPLPEGTIPPRASGPGFDHLVVVMFENRSFDNLLGYLYEAGVPEGQVFAGINEGPFSNRDHENRPVETHVYTGSTDEIMSSPRPDPGEDYPHVNTQLFGTVDPSSNAHAQVAQMQAPFNTPRDATAAAPPPMDGFVKDYVNTFHAERGTAPTHEEARVAMGAFSPDMLPVLSTLARGFAVFDHWHCAVPGPTFANRAFFHGSTSHGFVTNHDDGGYAKWRSKRADTPTIFNRLEEDDISWAVYYDDRQRVSLTGLMHERALKPYWRSRFFPMSHFYQACADGTLPAYAFIEPRMAYDHNDMHPPVGDVRTTEVDGVRVTGGAVSDVRAGEALLHEIYSAVRAADSHDGSNAMNTMLLVTFDEHGGTFDHVPPPAAVPPGDGADGEMGFAFDRLGLRVPAIAISAYTAAGRVINDPMHHACVISTLTTKYDLEPLTARDRGAPTLDLAVTLTEPRPASAWPQTHPQYTPRNPESSDPVPTGDDDRPLSPPGRGLLGLLAAHKGVSDATPATYRQAHAFLEQHGAGLFGPAPAP
ncbi:twin-arginine translocation signal domain-containing protein [Agromyces sp. SYSU K20354]|uniref:alkaline phosphatase family protein n=1 Tax=Agromyces cavernae TaxID=2898659 RepID=UPI001E575C98|nr:alkaline phosphatase family protein [Agromyces cavernae]MCD2443090.1 twin-arginine translocation signal domain-containing protein [Agromyces cavernae]